MSNKLIKLYVKVAKSRKIDPSVRFISRMTFTIYELIKEING